MMIYGIDWGAYLNSFSESAIPFADLHAAGLLDFFVVKGDQEAAGLSSVKNIQWAREAGCKCVGSYYWHYPTWSAAYQVQIYSEAIEREKPDFIALDMEDAYGLPDLTVTLNAEAVCEGLMANFPNLKLFVYTSADYINGHCPTFNRSINKYGRWVACWPGVIPTGAARYISLDKIKTYPLPGWEAKLPDGWSGWDIWQDNNWAIPAGYGWPYDHQYDWNVSSLTIEQITGKEEPMTEANIFDKTVPIADRAWAIEIPQTNVWVSPKNVLGVDLVILPMASMREWNDDNSHQLITTEETFPGRADAALSEGCAVAGLVELDAGRWLKEQFGKPTVEAYKLMDDPVIAKILDAWHIGAWKWEDIAAKKGNFRKLSAIILVMDTDDGWPKGTSIPDPWQKLTFSMVADHLRYLVENGWVSSETKIILKSTPDWLQKFYAGEFSVYIDSKKDWLRMIIEKPVLESTRTYSELWSIFSALSADYPGEITTNVKENTKETKKTFIPPDWENLVVGWLFSKDKQTLSQMAGKIRAYIGFAAADTFLKYFVPPSVTPTPDPDPDPDPKPDPDPTDPTLTAISEKLDTAITLLQNLALVVADHGVKLDRVDGETSWIFDWLTKFPQNNGTGNG